jgi:large subunit ribosomal protein L5
VRDFRGLPKKSFDGNGNYSFGIKEHIIFTEVAVKNVEIMRGLDVNIVTTTPKDEYCMALLKALNFPFVS